MKCLFNIFVSVLLGGVLFAGNLKAADVLHIEEDDIIDAIRQEFIDRGVAEDENIDLELFGGQTDFKFENAEEVKIVINRLKADEALGRFSCEAEFFADRKQMATSLLQGKYFPMQKVWVPADNIAKGELITAEKLKQLSVRKSRLKPFMVTDKEKLIGQEAQHSLKEGKIINEKDVGARMVIKRNDIVQAIYRTDKMQITAKAIALADGAIGDRIELQNAKTRKSLMGIVQDSSTVVVE